MGKEGGELLQMKKAKGRGNWNWSGERERGKIRGE
jgi:hypothetical protein